MFTINDTSFDVKKAVYSIRDGNFSFDIDTHKKVDIDENHDFWKLSPNLYINNSSISLDRNQTTVTIKDSAPGEENFDRLQIEVCLYVLDHEPLNYAILKITKEEEGYRLKLKGTGKISDDECQVHVDVLLEPKN